MALSQWTDKATIEEAENLPKPPELKAEDIMSRDRLERTLRMMNAAKVGGDKDIDYDEMVKIMTETKTNGKSLNYLAAEQLHFNRMVYLFGRFKLEPDELFLILFTHAIEVLSVCPTEQEDEIIDSCTRAMHAMFKRDDVRKTMIGVLKIARAVAESQGLDYKDVALELDEAWWEVHRNLKSREQSKPSSKD